jgi:hypothetical protein
MLLCRLNGGRAADSQSPALDSPQQRDTCLHTQQDPAAMGTNGRPESSDET